MLNNTNQSWLQGLNEFIDGKEPWFQRQQKRLDNSQGNSIWNSSALLWQPGISAPSSLTIPWNRFICTRNAVLCWEYSSPWAPPGWLFLLDFLDDLSYSRVVPPSHPEWAKTSLPIIPRQHPELHLELPAISWNGPLYYCLLFFIYLFFFFLLPLPGIPFHPLIFVWSTSSILQVSAKASSPFKWLWSLLIKSQGPTPLFSHSYLYLTQL